MESSHYRRACAAKARAKDALDSALAAFRAASDAVTELDAEAERRRQCEECSCHPAWWGCDGGCEKAARARERRAAAAAAAAA